MQAAFSNQEAEGKKKEHTALLPLREPCSFTFIRHGKCSCLSDRLIKGRSSIKSSKPRRLSNLRYWQLRSKEWSGIFNYKISKNFLQCLLGAWQWRKLKFCIKYNPISINTIQKTHAIYITQRNRKCLWIYTLTLHTKFYRT